MREIVLDTETTGLDPKDGHRVVEIGCVELNYHVPTGKELHIYINPERDMPEEAFKVHGLSADFLRDKPLFSQVVEEYVMSRPSTVRSAKLLKQRSSRRHL